MNAIPNALPRSAPASRWLLRRATGTPPRVRLICFSYAGGNGASYLHWQAALPDDVELVGVQLPGRGSRVNETPYRSMSALIEVLAQQLEALDDGTPFVFFGHSLGGLVAFELARHLHAHGRALPGRLIASGCDAPRFRSPVRALHELEGDAFLEALAQYNGTPPELLAHRELIALVSPAIRADFFMAAHYNYREAPLLPLPIDVFAGREDADSNLDELGAWQHETGTACTLRWFDGDHFFIQSRQAEVMAALREVLAP